jgi:CBS domain containing-hemolysin-like protein
MRPREEIEFLTLGVGVDQAARRAVQSGYTRLPVRERGLDAPVGLVHAHDLLAAAIDEGPVPLHGILRPLARVPASLPVTELLKRIREERREMVLAADDHGATVGLVSSRIYSRSSTGRSRTNRGRQRTARSVALCRPGILAGAGQGSEKQ